MPSLKRSLSCLLLCMLLLSASCSAKAKEFSKDGMHITRTDAFSEGKYYDMTASPYDVTYLYYAMVFRTDDAYWLFQFVCPKEKQETYEAHFMEWAGSIRFD